MEQPANQEKSGETTQVFPARRKQANGLRKRLEEPVLCSGTDPADFNPQGSVRRLKDIRCRSFRSQSMLRHVLVGFSLLFGSGFLCAEETVIISGRSPISSALFHPDGKRIYFATRSGIE